MGARVLLVEDHPTMREAVRMVLAGEGYEVIEASDGAGALEEVARERPDVMVLDLHMPVLDGAAVLASLRAAPATADLPVIVVTADGEEGRMAARHLGAD
jgi:CheY-like chemotaxis protein